MLTTCEEHYFTKSQLLSKQWTDYSGEQVLRLDIEMQ